MTSCILCTFFRGALLYNICCRMQPFIKQMCESARKFNANTRTNIKSLFKQPNLLLNIFNFWCRLFSFCYFQFFVVISATKRIFNHTVNTYFHSTNLTLSWAGYLYYLFWAGGGANLPPYLTRYWKELET